MVSRGMIKKRYNDMIDKGIEYDIDDIYVLPKNDHYAILYRSGEEITEEVELSNDIAQQLINYIKYIGQLNIGEKRLPQSGTIKAVGSKTTVRVSTLTNYENKESLVLRMHLDTKKEQKIDAYYPDDLKTLRKLIQSKNGLLLFSGPVSSGKTTLLYQLLRESYRHHQKQIITMEDPVELKENNFLQTEINEQAGITYDLLIKSALRHHPDILLIGEVRDETTAHMMLRAALTGHLVVATIHAKNCKGVLFRLLELGITKQQLIQSIVSITTQRLIPDKAGGRRLLMELMNGRQVEQLLMVNKEQPVAESFNYKLEALYKSNTITAFQRDAFYLH